MREEGNSRAGLAATAYELARRDIIRCELAPGQRVTKAQLEARYGLGQAAIRDALARLSQERLVQVIPREAFVIAPITLKQVEDLYDARLIVEPAAARLAAGRVDADELRRLDAEYRALHDRHDQETLARRVQADAAFHIAIARMTNNEKVAAIVANLRDEMARFIHLSYVLGEQLHLTPDSSHRALIDALVAGDGEEAAAVMVEQIRTAKAYVLTALYASPSLKSVNLATV